MNIYEVIRRPLVTEKGVEQKDTHRTLCFEVALDANKTQVKSAVEKLFKVKVAEGAFRRLPVRLEESLREAEGGRKGARFRRDLERKLRYADQDL